MIDWTILATHSTVKALADQIKAMIKTNSYMTYTIKMITVDGRKPAVLAASFINLGNSMVAYHKLKECSAGYPDTFFNQPTNAKLTDLLLTKTAV